MSDIAIWDLVTPTMALRHLIQGRVLLQSDYTDGVTVKVGREFSAGKGIAGSNMFKDKSTACKLVQPETAPNAADGWEENVTIVNPDGEPLHITLTQAAAQDYTVAGGAYLAIQDSELPDAITDLELVHHDLQMLGDATTSHLPSVLVGRMSAQKSHPGSVQYRYEFIWDCRYYRLRIADEDPIAFYADFDAVLNQIEEDKRIGGTVGQAEVIAVRRQEDLPEPLPFDIGEFRVWAQVDRTYVKAL